MGWVCARGHFIGVNLDIELEGQRRTECPCGAASWPMIVCTSAEFAARFEELRRSRAPVLSSICWTP